ncbi:MAG: aldo/keto reductase [Deltaproteobacteria bacterium]|nr:aldo/keto reductase [Deltaproteobacteria bacterium]MBW2051548.1 aldo/keto reductase [Deltaproteobacteria bacterium]MBW2140113.1 aldo/keto reductase [Deltaproteobacteria bacterium]MBW2322038.1 aldo/keto reductase [Deltaproteobacteria bacterium]
METRRFGRTGHMSTVAILGSYAFSKATQAETDPVMEQVIEAGVNHIDVAPSYGLAEERLGPWLARERDRFFLGCKTGERSKAEAAAELRRSLDRLQVDHFDLYQIHGITSIRQLDEVTQTGGALEAIIEAREEGLTRFIGITGGHSLKGPATFTEALRRFDFDSILFPLNFILYANPGYRKKAEELLAKCHEGDVGTMIIKSIAHGAWGDQPQSHNTWYRPYTNPDDIQRAVNFVLSQNVTGLCTAGDMRLLPLILQACENFTALNEAGQEETIAAGSKHKPLFE